MRFSNPKNITAICLTSFFSVLIILILDSFTLNYWIKSIIKLTTWGASIAVACRPKPLSILKPKWHKSCGWTIILSALAMTIVMSLAKPLIPLFDLQQTQGHITNIGVAENYWLVSAYIVLVNCTLEELFFRGMCGLKLEENSNRTFAIMYSSILFAVYHIPMMTKIFPTYLTLICLVALFFAGIIFAMLNSRTKNIYNAWVVHACTNIALQYFGYLLMGA